MDKLMSDSIGELTEAMAKARLEFKPIIKNKTVQIDTKSGRKIKYSYAELPLILQAVEGALSNHGLYLFQPPFDNGNRTLVTLLSHKSGQWIMSKMTLNNAIDTKEYGAQITYYRRYSVCGLLGIAADDDESEEQVEGIKAIAEKPKEEAKPVESLPPMPLLKALLDSVDKVNPEFSRNLFNFYKIEKIEDMKKEKLNWLKEEMVKRLEEAKK